MRTHVSLLCHAVHAVLEDSPSIGWQKPSACVPGMGRAMSPPEAAPGALFWALPNSRPLLHHQSQQHCTFVLKCVPRFVFIRQGEVTVTETPAFEERIYDISQEEGPRNMQGHWDHSFESGNRSRSGDNVAQSLYWGFRRKGWVRQSRYTQSIEDWTF